MQNPYTFPLVGYEQGGVLLPPEAAPRSGSGAWAPYSLAVPFDRLLPFVLTRAISSGGATIVNSNWLNCARIVHADTGQTAQELRPVGYTQSGEQEYDLVFYKYVDPARAVEHFVYYGGLVRGLGLPCGVPYRLLIDEQWQSPRFETFYTPSDYMRLEWWQDGPANGVPYGQGFRHRLFLKNAALQYADPTTEQVITQDGATGQERIESITQINNATLAVEPVPRYLAEAISGMRAAGHLLLDEDPWLASDIKSSAPDEDGGRWLLAVSVKQPGALVYKASCPEPALVDAGYNPQADAPHPWHCGDLTDTAPEWITYDTECVVTNNIGYIHLKQQDINPGSTTYNQLRDVPTGERCQ